MGLLLAATAGAAMASPACFLSDVREKNGKVDLYVGAIQMGVVLPPQRERFTFTSAPGGKIAILSGPDAGKQVDALVTSVGDTISMAFGPENTCDLTVVSRDGKLGVELRSMFVGYATPPIDTKKFVEATPEP